MASTVSLYSSIRSYDSFPKTRTAKPVRVTSTRIYAARDHKFSGRVVDENLIVLRKRIHEMKMVESGYELPSEWMDWEKRVYASYDSVICDAMGHLQSYLMETRPSLAIGMFVLIALSVPTSAAVVMYNLLELSKGLTGIHLS